MMIGVGRKHTILGPRISRLEWCGSKGYYELESDGDNERYGYRVVILCT